MPVALMALALSAFAIGTTEFVIMGLLPEVARDLQVSIPSAGWLISGYALGVAIGAPIMALLTARLRTLSWCLLRDWRGCRRQSGACRASGFGCGTDVYRADLS